jgi:hypothetical protein
LLSTIKRSVTAILRILLLSPASTTPQRADAFHA